MFYIEYMLKSTKKEDMSINLARDVIGMFEKGYFTLTKFFSNSRNVLTTTLEERLNKKIKKQVLVERALIIHWDIENKYFAFEIQLKYKSVTSRRMLPTISTVYDPLGIAASFVLEGLQILHRLCYLKSEGMKRYRII